MLLIGFMLKKIEAMRDLDMIVRDLDFQIAEKLFTHRNRSLQKSLHCSVREKNIQNLWLDAWRTPVQLYIYHS